MAVKRPFDFMSSVESETPNGIWGWAKRLIEDLQKWRLLDLYSTSLDGNGLKVVRVNADETAYELADEELGLSGADLTGKANNVVRVKADESGYEITPEELGLYGVSLVGKGGFFVKVKADESGFEIVP